MSRTKATLLIATACSLVPAWIGSALLEQLTETTTLFNSTLGIVILILFALSFWGTSFGFFYLKRYGYGMLSGFGKWVIMLVGILVFWLSSSPEELQHPYLIFIGIFLAFCWGIFDFIFLYTLAKKSNLEE